jgi:catalase
MQSVVWDEAVKINGTDPDFHRCDLWNAIQAGDFPQWDLGVQVFDAEFADAFEFDVLDPTKLIPEEVVPVRIIARLTLDRVVDNVFAETESGDTRRIRAETFADHYSQASLFHRSQTPVEQQHITDAFAHHKFIVVGSAAGDLLAAAEGEADEGMVAVGDSDDAAAFLELCQALRHWARDVLP